MRKAAWLLTALGITLPTITIVLALVHGTSSSAFSQFVDGVISGMKFGLVIAVSVLTWVLTMWFIEYRSRSADSNGGDSA